MLSLQVILNYMPILCLGSLIIAATSAELTTENSADEVWTESMKSVAAITVGGNSVIIIFMYFDLAEKTLSNMISFAVGGLLGDVFLHLLPHARSSYESHSQHQKHHEQHHHNHAHDSHGHEDIDMIGMAVLAGILIFFILENLLEMSSHGHDHVVDKKKDNNENKKPKKLTTYLRQPGVILNLIADTAHNFTDGLALAAAHKLGGSMGTSMTIAVTLHEIPHELGDFAVLLSNGLSKEQALGLQFVSALGAVAGCVFGLTFSSEEPSLVLAFTAGGFIYVAVANLLPDLTKQEKSFGALFTQVFLFFLGVFSMVLVSHFEEHSHHSH